MKITKLNKGWQGRCTPPSGVPFSYKTDMPTSSVKDLIAEAKLPKEIFASDNYKAIAEYEEASFEYTLEFFPDGAASRKILRFERIDTYAEIYLNGKHLASVHNGNIAHKFDVTVGLCEGKNVLSISLRSPITEVKDKEKRPGAFTTERLYTRRMQCSYGWDWVARFVSVGIGNVSLLTLDENELIPEDVYVYTDEYDNESASIVINARFSDLIPSRVLSFEILTSEGEVCARRERYVDEDYIRVDLTVPSPKLWYPNGYGEQPLYTLRIIDGNKQIYSHIFGIRTVMIEEICDLPESDSFKKCEEYRNKEYDKNTEFSSFGVKINRRKVFCKGANWVPPIPYIGENTDERVTKTLELARDAGLNVIRVWGGGAFESEHFYMECSRLGIMVIQDFLMACGHYPENDEEFIKELNREAEYAALLIRNFPALILWQGDNENAIMGYDTAKDHIGRSSAYRGIAPVLYKLDPKRRFLPSSPYGGLHFASNTFGTTHNTQYLSEFWRYFLKDDMSDYKEFLGKFKARFISEEPQIGASFYGSLRRFMSNEEIYGEDESCWYSHTQSNPALEMELYDYIKRFAEGIFGSFTDPRDRHFKLMYLQHEWLRLSMENARRESGFCNGIIYWMLNDCWPTACSWSIIDHYGDPKPAYYAFKHAASPISLSLYREDGKYKVAVCSNAIEEEDVGGVLKIIDSGSRSVIGCGYFSSSVKPGEIVTPVELDASCLGMGELAVVEIYGHFGNVRSFYREGGLKLVPTDVGYTVDKDKKLVHFESLKYVHAVAIDGGVTAEDNMFSLLPGEVRDVAFSGDADSVTVTAYTYCD